MDNTANKLVVHSTDQQEDRRLVCIQPNLLAGLNQFKACLVDNLALSKVFSVYYTPAQQQLQSQTDFGNLKHGTAHFLQCSSEECSSSTWSSRPARIYVFMWHCSITSRMSSNAYEAVLKQPFHKETGPFWLLELISLTKLELSPDADGRTDIPGILAWGTTCKNAQAVTVWSQLLHNTTAVLLLVMSNTALVMRHCTHLS